MTDKHYTQLVPDLPDVVKSPILTALDNGDVTLIHIGRHDDVSVRFHASAVTAGQCLGRLCYKSIRFKTAKLV